MASTLSNRALQLVQSAHRPKTQNIYRAQFRLFMALAVYMDIQDFQQLQYIMCFLTYLYDSGLMHGSIAGYLAAVKHGFVYYRLDVAVFDDRLIKLLLKSFAINGPLRIRIKGVIDIELLKKIIIACDYLDQPLMYKALFLMAFFTFLRISNFTPLGKLHFDTTRQLTRGDIVWGVPGAHMIIKWAKNMQERNECHVVQIHLIKNPLLCPVTALQLYFKKFPGASNSPMFVVGNSGVPVIQSNIRNALKIISNILDLPSGFLTFHAFRRSGATFAFNHSVSLQNIQSHGGWKSQAVWSYLTQTHKGTVRVASAFAKHIL